MGGYDAQNTGRKDSDDMPQKLKQDVNRGDKAIYLGDSKPLSVPHKAVSSV